jgi:hypothetical protein
MKTKLLTLFFMVMVATLHGQSTCYDYTSVSYTPPDGQMNATSQISYLGGNASLTAWIRYGNGNGGQLKKPFIFVEGIDFKVCNKSHKFGDFGCSNLA